MDKVYGPYRIVPEIQTVYATMTDKRSERHYIIWSASGHRCADSTSEKRAKELCAQYNKAEGRE